MEGVHFLAPEMPVVADPPLRERLARNVEGVEARIRAACERAGRPREAVTLVAVTKSAPDEVTPLLPELGLVHLGENRPQELWRKSALLPAGVHWHLIGHLQRNKVEKTLPLTRLLHSVDSLRLLQAIEEAAARAGRRADVLLEVNTSREASKQGFSPADLPGLAGPLSHLQSVTVRGLMTMAAFKEDPADCRPCFSLLRSLRDRLAHDFPGLHDFANLSMGMSNDFEVAI
jgi:pyridoxal phosphate enzyme (YggS family)